MSTITKLEPRRTIAAPEDLAWFWAIVDATVGPAEDAQVAALKSRLEPLSDRDLVEFIHLFRGVHHGLNSMRLWAAAYLVNGGCSDDGFIDFRNWLMSRGRSITERTLADPDSLADLDVEMDSASFEWFGYVMIDVYRARAQGAYPTIRGEGAGSGERDLDWNFDFDDHDEMRRRLPRLAAKYLP